jgi:hypothetical protein
VRAPTSSSKDSILRLVPIATRKRFASSIWTYSAQRARTTLDELGQYAAGRNPKGYTETDVPRLIKEVRVEKPRRHRGTV